MAEVATMASMRLVGERDTPFAPADEAPLLTASPAMQHALALADAVAPRDTTVLIVGETGSGKGVLARHIHGRSWRRRGPFVELDCAALPKERAESELFGHEKGAFPGAERKIGLFEAAEGGTLFLDEVGEMDLGVQARLLRVLESRKIRRAGSVADIPCNVRVIAATHRRLPTRVTRGEFRADLYHRLNVFTIAVPPLRQRIDDIEGLAERFLREHASGEAPVLGDEARQRLRAHPWPGNVRELRNAMERAAILCPPGGRLTPEHLPLALPEDAPSEVPSATRTMRAADCEQIAEAIRACEGNVRAAARMLGVARSTIYRKAQKYGIPV